MNEKVFLMSGAGNLFSVFDNRKLKIDFDRLALIANKLCNIFSPIKTEGLIVLNNDNLANFNIDFFNPDGSYGMMCGNGGRCAVKFANFLKIITKNQQITFKMADKEYFAKFLNANICLEFEKPIFIHRDVQLHYEDESFDGDYINVGSDHYCINIEKIKTRKELIIFSKKWGSLIRSNVHFERGANANFYFIKNNIIHLSTFERGVEDITGACGTGAIATALSAALRGNISFPVTIKPPSNQKLTIEIEGSLNKIEKIFLIGNAKILNSLDYNFKD